MKKGKSCTLIALLIALSTAQQAAKALDVDAFYLDMFAKGQPNAPAAQQNKVRSMIDSRRRDIENDLNSANRGGRLTSAQEQDIRARLNYVSTLQTQYLADGVLSNTEASSLFGEESRADKQLQYYLGLANTTPVSTPTTGTSFRTSSGALRNIDRRVRDLDSDFRSAVRANRLTKEQQDDIRTRITYIGTLQTNYLSDGVLSDADLSSLNGEAERTDKQLQYYLSLQNNVGAVLPSSNATSATVSSAAIDARIAQLETRLNAAVRANAIGWNDAQQARAEIDQIRQKHRASVHDGTLAPLEEQMLTSMINNFDTQLAASTGSRNYHWSAYDPGVSRNGWNNGRGNNGGRNLESIDARQQQMKERIWAGLQSRKLSQKEADRLMRSLNRIEALELQLKGDGRISNSERKLLHSEMDQLFSKLNRELNDYKLF